MTTDEELLQKVKDRIKGTLEIPAQFAKTKSSHTSIEERVLLMDMIEDILFYIEDWETNRQLLYKAIKDKNNERSL